MGMHTRGVRVIGLSACMYVHTGCVCMYITTPQRQALSCGCHIGFVRRISFTTIEQSGKENPPNKPSNICFQPPRKCEFLRCATCIDHILCGGRVEMVFQDRKYFNTPSSNLSRVPQSVRSTVLQVLRINYTLYLLCRRRY